ncbi:MAG TPA: mannose-6-phosphate isomerase [Opitutae bacterium]|nr:mannose-6-phosphate isomerase [Opitutae bacterium]|tara:strand:- start:2825 stop:3151 length:327 start_codon:yes stop_codon:yes gene_type:complete
MVPTHCKLKDVFASIEKPWAPVLVGEVNATQIKCFKAEGEFHWHKHDHEDELFYIHAGELIMQLREENTTLQAGEFFIVPQGIEHCPLAPQSAEVVLVEPANTMREGD